eukprot:1467780-Prymnesium_polylepis.1
MDLEPGAQEPRTPSPAALPWPLSCTNGGHFRQERLQRQRFRKFQRGPPSCQGCSAMGSRGRSSTTRCAAGLSTGATSAARCGDGRKPCARALRPLDCVPRACSRGLRSQTHPSIAWEGLRDAGVSIAWEGLREAGVTFAGEAGALRGRM